MIDLHCHVLPGIDDGPQTLDDTFRLARTAAEGGTHTIVATPHVSYDYPHNTSASIRAGVTEVNRALLEEGIELTVLPGAEVALTRALELPDEELAALRLGGGPYLLLEPPISPAAAAGVEQGVLQVASRGHRLLIAHPERVPAFLQQPELLDRLVGGGMLTQFTAGSFAGRFGKDVQKFSLRAMEEGWVHDVASDAHSSRRRPPTLRAELEEAGFGALADWCTREVPQAILSGAPLPPRPALPKRKRGLFGRR